MHKFTVFSILLSISVVLVLLDVLTHNYLNRHDSAEISSVQETTSSEFPLDAETPEGDDGLNQDLETQTEAEITPTPDSEDQESLPGINLAPGTIAPETTDTPVELQSVPSTIEAWLGTEALSRAGFQAPVLKNAPSSDLIFQFLTKPANASIFQWNFFDGQDYIGTLVEIAAQTETEGFQNYLQLRDEANRSNDLGTVNEMNLYGDASFYFNHFIQSKTIRIVIRRDSRVFALEYRHEAHDVMKKLFDILGEAE